MMKRALIGLVCLATFAGLGNSFAVSDGHYRPHRNHCTNFDDNSDTPKYVNPNCKSLIYTLSDGTGHEYFGAGARQTPDGTFANTIDFWVDPGQGQMATWYVDSAGLHGPKMVPSAGPGDPSTGLFIYFGADDNLDGGEHDSSNFINNGPSDGGGMEYNIDPATAAAWVAALQAGDVATLLENPTPLLNAGLGSCADGLCMSVDTTRRVAFQGGDKHSHRDVANYAGKQWDPYGCAGPSDTAKDCSGPTNNGWTIKHWADQEGTVYIEPGFQFYEDPDPQGSPGVLGLVGIPQNDPYPLPALYIGSCGAILGGGPMQFPAGPGVNSAGQLVIPTGCN
jgi:hypothetical protein